MPVFYSYFSSKGRIRVLPNYWDSIALILVFSIIGALAWGAKQMSAPYSIGQSLPISLDPHHLPEYALLTVLRMLIAMVFSLLFTFTIATWAAKSRRAGQLIIPCIDILQSVPVIGMLSITIIGFIELFPGSRLGPECASIFAVFVNQVWNMALSFYQSLRTVPVDMKEAADMFHLSSWQRFWRIEVPFAMPGLLWNMMLSMSGSWIFVVASEAISVSNQNISLPGIGSYLSLAISQRDIHAVGYAILAMLCVILLYDQLLFRPLLAWSEKFKAEYTSQERVAGSWVVTLLQRTRVLQHVGKMVDILSDALINLSIFRSRKNHFHPIMLNPVFARSLAIVWNIMLVAIVLTAAFLLVRFVSMNVGHAELIHVFFLGLCTAARVLAVVLISSLIWVPIGVWIGLHPRIAEFTQPLAQFLAAFPVNVVFPVVVLAIIKYNLNVNIWVTSLMFLGVQWYILFNIIAGTIALPKDLLQVADNFGVTGWQWWRRLILPGIFPYYITGTITAIGNAWNTSILAEVVSWGSTKLTAVGLGAYIMQYTGNGDFPRVALGIGVMCLFVLTMNRLVWRPLYNIAQARYRLD